MLLALLLIAADVQGQAQVVTTQPTGTLQTQMGPMNLAMAGHHDVNVSVLSADTFVVVKDVGDSQVVMVYRVDSHGKVQLMHRARFYY